MIMSGIVGVVTAGAAGGVEQAARSRSNVKESKRGLGMWIEEMTAALGICQGKFTR
jgi:hypothetical protein